MTRAAIWTRSLMTGVAAAIAYGIVHDQITVRISPEYLMVTHPQIVASEDPAIVALAWGVFATWWFGLILGAALAAAAMLGGRTTASWPVVRKAVGSIFLVTAAAASAVGAVVVARRVELPFAADRLATYDVGPEKAAAWSQSAIIHEVSYDVAGAATLVAAIILFRGRKAAPGAALDA